MKVTIAKGWGAVLVLLAVAALVAVVVWAVGDTAAVKTWLDTPLRDARIRDVAPVLFIAALLAR